MRGILFAQGLLGFLAFTLAGVLSEARATSEYSKSIAAHLNLQMDHFNELSRQVNVGTPSFLQSLGIINKNASASYNGLSNTIVISEEFLIKEDGPPRLRTLQESKRGGHSYQNYAGIVFHEFAHAEYDHYLKPGKTPIDKLAYSALSSMTNDIILRLRPDINYFKRRILLSEVFAYYREEIITTLLKDADEIMFQSGIFYNQGKCGSKKYISAQLARHNGVSNQYFDDFVNTSQPYKDRIQMQYAFVDGEDIDFLPAQKEMKTVYGILWDQFDYYFKPPRSRVELLAYMNSNPSYLKMLEACHNQ